MQVGLKFFPGLPITLSPYCFLWTVSVRCASAPVWSSSNAGQKKTSLNFCIYLCSRCSDLFLQLLKHIFSYSSTSLYTIITNNVRNSFDDGYFTLIRYSSFLLFGTFHWDFYSSFPPSVLLVLCLCFLLNSSLSLQPQNFFREKSLLVSS